MTARLLVAAAILALAAVAANAADPAADVPLPPITPKGQFLVMTKDDATSTSKCIGNPVTPMCAVETVLACNVRGIDELCRIGMGLKTYPKYNFGPSLPEIYRVVRREILTDRRFPWRPDKDLDERPGEISLQAGDIRIDLFEKDCWHDTISPTACTTDPDIPSRVAFIVRRQGDRWAVIDWRPPYDHGYIYLRQLFPSPH